MHEENPGSARTSFIYNPLVVTPAGSSTADLTRLYQKLSQVNSRKLVGLDSTHSNAWLPGRGVDLNGVNFAHRRSKGWNVVFTSASVEFKKVYSRTKAVYALGGFNDGQYDVKGMCELARLAFEQLCRPASSSRCIPGLFEPVSFPAAALGSPQMASRQRA